MDFRCLIKFEPNVSQSPVFIRFLSLHFYPILLQDPPPLLGSSPPLSFEYELAHFMAASVAQVMGGKGKGGETGKGKGGEGFRASFSKACISEVLTHAVLQTRGSAKRSVTSAARARSMAHGLTPVTLEAAAAHAMAKRARSRPGGGAMNGATSSSMGVSAAATAVTSSSDDAEAPSGSDGIAAASDEALSSAPSPKGGHHSAATAFAVASQSAVSAQIPVPFGVPLLTHTFLRVNQIRQTRQHPLAGLWKGARLEPMSKHGRMGKESKQTHPSHFNYQSVQCQGCTVDMGPK